MSPKLNQSEIKEYRDSRNNSNIFKKIGGGFKKLFKKQKERESSPKRKNSKKLEEIIESICNSDNTSELEHDSFRRYREFKDVQSVVEELENHISRNSMQFM